MYVLFQYFKSCLDVYQKGKPLPGVYTIQPDPDVTHFDVNCLQEGWTVIQSRGEFGNPADFFKKIWHEYEKGFGTPGT